MKNPAIKGLFITGTDTDIGKTYISRILADSFSSIFKTTYMKPVQTGCFMDKNGTLLAPDFQYVLSGKAVMTGTLDQHIPYRFESACSPHLAARLAKQQISFEHITNCLLKIAKDDTMVLVEGAGGILAPLSETTYVIDLIKHLHLPVIVVTSPHLGTLNHTFLTFKVLQLAGAQIAGIVLNNCRNDPEDYIYLENVKMIQDHTRPVPFLEVQHGNSCNERLSEFCRKVKEFV